MSYLIRLKEKINSFKSLSNKTTENGTELLGHVPHVAPKAYLHILFAPLKSNDIKDLELLLNTEVPDIFKEFLMFTNGLCLFSNTLNIYGLRKSFQRTGTNIWQPFSIETGNVRERIADAKDNYFFIGGYRSDGSKVYIDKNDLKVYMCSSDSSAPLKEWNDFPSFIHNEYDRIALLFDDKGKKINV